MKFSVILALFACNFTSVFATSSDQPTPKTVVNLAQYEKRIFSQNGEDGVIQAIFNYIGTTSKYYVEFGATDGHEFSNTKYLRTQCSWSGLLLDAGFENPSINLHKEFITAANINTLFEKYNVSENLDFLSIDIDFNDFYVWHALDNKYRPRLVVIEYNSTHPPHEDKIAVQNPFQMWDGTNYFGASILSLYNLGRSKGYSLVYADSQGVNLFFVKDECLEQIPYTFANINNVSALYRKPLYGAGPNGGHAADPHHRFYVSSKEFITQENPH